MPAPVVFPGVLLEERTPVQAPVPGKKLSNFNRLNRRQVSKPSTRAQSVRLGGTGLCIVVAVAARFRNAAARNATTANFSRRMHTMKIRHSTAAALAAVCFVTDAVNAAPSALQLPGVAARAAEARADGEGAYKLPPPGMFPMVADVETKEIDVVEVTAAPADTTAADTTAADTAAANPTADDANATAANTTCGMTVVSKSEHAVGNPCATTGDVMAALALSDAQIAYINAHGTIGEAALAH